jgi:hypothetical protein
VESQIPTGAKGLPSSPRKISGWKNISSLAVVFLAGLFIPNETSVGVLDLALWRFASSVTTWLTRKKTCFRVGF